MRIRRRKDQAGATGSRQPVNSGGQAQAATPLEPAADAMAAIRRAEEAAAARLAAEEAEQAEQAAARRRADALLEQASARAAELAEQRRQAVRAAVAAEVEHEHAMATVETGQLQQAARDHHDLAVRLAVAFVLTGEARCSSR
jgi:hypothetical protein